MTKVQNTAIFTEIAETGYITETQLRLIKNRSNKYIVKDGKPFIIE